jgi:hypothetical protein
VDTQLAEHAVQVFGVALNAVRAPGKGLFRAAGSPVVDGDAPVARRKLVDLLTPDIGDSHKSGAKAIVGPSP